MKPIELPEQIAAVNRELYWRARVYPRRVQAGSMTNKEAAYQLEAMRAVLLTLIDLQKAKAPELPL